MHIYPRGHRIMGLSETDTRTFSLATDGRIARMFLLTLMTVGLLLGIGISSDAAETPTSAGSVARLDTPIFRIPMTDNPPEIDGEMKEGEWVDASALSGFWYDFMLSHFYYMAPDETQVEVYGAYDKDNLYIAYKSPVYPEGSWLKSRGRYSDVTHDPRYGIIWDDHIELEIRPFEDNAKGFKLGLFKWFVNPTGTVADSYWSPQAGQRDRWQSGVRARSDVSTEEWTLEMKIPLEELKTRAYGEQDSEGDDYVELPPPPETAYRVWFTRGIGGNGGFFNVFDSHVWNTTKTKMILDPDTVSFQINELGPIMKDVIDLRMTVKNHSDRAKTLRLGFFVESAGGTIYSSYDSSELEDGLLELHAGEVKELEIKKPFPGISERGNTLWFDVREKDETVTFREAAKPVFQTRLIDFHSFDADMIEEDGMDFEERRLDVITEELRPPREPFDVRYNYSKFTNRLSAVVDKGIHGADEDAKRATEAKITILDKTEGGAKITEDKEPFNGYFSTFLIDLPDLNPDHTYEVSLLLFDENKQIVGEDSSMDFSPGALLENAQKTKENADNVDVVPVEEWKDNEIGREDIVWDPFTEMEVTPEGFETLNHRFEISDSGLPAQIYIKADERDLPLEKRGTDADLSAEQLQKLGRGPQLRNPMQLEVKSGGETYVASVSQEAELVKEWDSELVYESELEAGPLEITLETQYDCDGSIHCSLTYGSEEEVQIDGFDLVTDIDGPVDMVASGKKSGSMAGSDVWECTLPHSEGVVWDSSNIEKPDLYYSHFVRFMFFGTGDRGFSWYAPSDRHWQLDKDGSSMQLSRNEDGEVSWRVMFANHSTKIDGHQTLDFHILTHPAKPKPEGYRELSWFYRGDQWAMYYFSEPVEVSEQHLKDDRSTFDKEGPPWSRIYQCRQVGIAPELDYQFEQRAVYYLARQIREGKRPGYWWDESWPGFGTSDNVAAGNAYFRDPDEVDDEDEVPWQKGFTMDHMRRTHKRLARVFKEEDVPQRQYHWANNAATLYESLAWDTQLVEECGSGHRSFEVDMVGQFPSSLWRYQAHHFTGLVSRVVPGPAPASPGDDPRLDRQYLGRALLNDIGVCFDGPHGSFQNPDIAMELINDLIDFGYFDKDDTQFMAYWRNQDVLRLGPGRRTDAHLEPIAEQEPRDHLYVTAYRRPVEKDGKKGYKVLFVLMNESDEAVETDLHILKPESLFGEGGRNEIRLADEVADRGESDDRLGEKLQDWAEKAGDVPVLRDIETGEVVAQSKSDDEDGTTYGPIWIPYHNYRVLYGYSVTNDAE